MKHLERILLTLWRLLLLLCALLHLLIVRVYIDHLLLLCLMLLLTRMV